SSLEMFVRPTTVVHMLDLPGSALRRAIGSLCAVVVCGLAYLAALEIGTALRFPDGSFAALWPANAVLLSALMLTRARRWWLYILAVIPAHVAAYVDGDLVAFRLAWQVAHNCALSLAAAAFLR